MGSRHAGLRAAGGAHTLLGHHGGEIRRKVLAVDLRYPPNLLSKEAIQVFHCLMRREPRSRTPAAKLLEHPWVRQAEGKPGFPVRKAFTPPVRIGASMVDTTVSRNREASDETEIRGTSPALPAPVVAPVIRPPARPCAVPLSAALPSVLSFLPQDALAADLRARSALRPQVLPQKVTNFVGARVVPALGTAR
ncbi:unnamed protein product [Effrenium voratum]|nr:unnamed protein product [Effrenium voratum]